MLVRRNEIIPYLSTPLEELEDNIKNAQFEDEIVGYLETGAAIRVQNIGSRKRKLRLDSITNYLWDIPENLNPN